MRKTYIATTQEAKALHDGTQTAIITKMRVQQNKVDWNPIVVGKNKGWCDEHGRAIPAPYTIGQEVVVREKWIDPLFWDGELGETPDVKWNSPATMPVSAARTRFTPVSCEAVRVQSILGNSGLLYPLTCGKDGIECGRNLYKHSVRKLGQSAWDNNHYVFYYKIEKI